MGNALAANWSWSCFTVHPHVHGERYIRRRQAVYGGGSSPRTWGTPRRRGGRRIRDRFIPTYMGNAMSSSWLAAVSSVHPHVHGERLFAAIPDRFTVGSSPRTWGTPHTSACLLSRFRFIPTYMGNASGVCSTARTDSVHPHVHGERANGVLFRTILGGSSPRTWGTPRSRQRTHRRLRFIPTYMGNAEGRYRSCRPGAVHPHVHGERSSLRYGIVSSTGSSPRTWGTPYPGYSLR